MVQWCVYRVAWYTLYVPEKQTDKHQFLKLTLWLYIVGDIF